MKQLQNSVTALLIVCTLMLMPVTLVVAQRHSRPHQDPTKLFFFEQFVKNQMAKDKIPGLTIGFMKGDRTRRVLPKGWAN